MPLKGQEKAQEKAAICPGEVRKGFIELMLELRFEVCVRGLLGRKKEVCVFRKEGERQGVWNHIKAETAREF